ncbi:hypothetical protein [Streptomyces sp. PD-S100-1]|uniref:hypothetical protein n=1 Tax=Streptomyces sp. PD-S100-1 TaxID=3394351 RepID=UPI0039BCA667
MRRSLPLVLLAACLALTACGPGPVPRAADPRSLPSGDPRYRPLDAYDTTDAEAAVLGEARWTLAKECMRGLGFDSLRELKVRPAPPWPRRPAGTGVLTLEVVVSDEFRYGVQDPEQAAAHGYRSPAAEDARHRPRRQWTLPEYLALTGDFVGDDPRTVHGRPIPARGCLGQAERRLHGGVDPRDRTDPVRTLSDQALREARRDPAWKSADRAWSACMRAAGYGYATPQDAQEGRDRREAELKQRLSGGPDADGPTGQEKRAATADARCKQRTGYVRAVHAVDVRVQARLVAGHRGELERQRARVREAVRTARAVLESR